jgi:NADH:ubiquinone oxidoreductase subunit 5 (subunit L)/multisubunit Na+/H+ antiporter MnhA subunit
MGWLTVMNCLVAAALLPFAGFVLLMIWGNRMGRGGVAAGVVGLVVAVASLGLSLGALLLWVSHDSKAPYIDAFTYRWIELPGASPSPVAMPGPITDSAAPVRVGRDALTVGCMVDSLSIALFMVFTLVNVLVHLFALGSLSGSPASPDPAAREAPRRDDNRPRKFALLALLNFAFLGLVLANSLPQLYLFWELLGLAAFFLVRLGIEAPPGLGPRAALRMYLMNALGSAAFLLGIGILIVHSGSLSGLGLFDSQGVSILSRTVRGALGVQSSEFLHFPGGEGFLQMHWLTWMGICFLVAALARMAQFPFQTWLDDAVESPAAVTALIAATSLGAGVCLLARLYPVLTLDTRLIAAVIGVVTLTVGALIALVQNDCRKILAWSTVSQAGYVLLFLGSGGYAAGILHLFTHGFVKTALFFAAGAVIQGYATADVRQMGGLWKRFPITAAGSLLAVLALAGVPWMSGSYSTNCGLAGVYDYAHALQATSGRHFELLLFHLPAAVTYITALGMGRWWWLIFAASSRNAKLYEAADERAFLTLPIILLAGLYVGWLYDFAGILPLIGRSVPADLMPGGNGNGGGGALIVNATAEAWELVIRDTSWAFLGLLVAVLIHVRGVAFSSRIRRLPGVNLVDYWLRERMFFDDLFEGILLPAVRSLPALTGLVERAGRALVKGISNGISLALTFAAHVEKKNREEAAPPPEEPTGAGAGQEGGGSAAG